ncbi:MAG: hypothetical protein GXO65_07590 [Euryarchaeota archaeon]|nr:hypothetical protein [Euryarchaeota archaeon]
MKILEILRSEPCPAVERIIEAHKAEHEVKVVRLYEGDPDYPGLLEAIFESEKAISWW